MLLRNVTPEDLDAYVRMRCDPEMTAHLGGPQRVEDMPDKVRRDVAAADADRGWILMICPDDEDPESVAGCVTLWTHSEDGPEQSEIGWMVLPEFQGRGLAKAAVSEVLRRASADGRWGPIHAHPSVHNAASNALCSSLGFRLAEEKEILYRDTKLRVNHWIAQETQPPQTQPQP